MSTARLAELPTLVRVYDEDKRVQAHIPLSDFSKEGGLKRGDEITVECGPTRARGRIVRLVALVEVDLSTVEQGADPNQGALL